MDQWQSTIALGIVALTLLVFLIRMVRKPKRKGGCGHDCGCGKTGKPG